MNNFMQNLQMLQQANQEYQMRPRVNPVSSGASEAMRAARESIELNEGQRKRAMGAGLAGLFSNMQAPAPNTGLAGAIGMINSSMNPAIQNYMNQYNREQDLNRQLLARHDEMQRHQEEQAYKRRLHDEELAYKLAKMEEDRAYNNRYLDLMNEKVHLKAEKDNAMDHVELPPLREGESPISLDVSGYAPMTTKAQHNAYFKAKNLSDKTLKEVKDAKKLLKRFEESSRDSLIRQDNPTFGKLTSKVQDVLADVGSKGYQNLRTNRKMLEQKLANIRTLVESNAKGGTPGETMMKRWEEKGLSVDLNQGAQTTIKNLDELERDLKKLSMASDIGFKTKRLYTPMDLENDLYGDESDEENSVNALHSLSTEDLLRMRENAR